MMLAPCTRIGQSRRVFLRISRGVVQMGAFVLLTACGGAASVVTPAVKTCAEDPTQAKCVVASADTGLRYYANTRGGRFMGTALDTLFLSPPAGYTTLVAREFSLFTPKNVLKWDAVHPTRATFNFTRPDAMLAFAQANGMKMRGHTLAWYNQNPLWLLSGGFSADTMTQILKDHIAAVVGHYKGSLYAWDVVNEAFTDAGALRDTVWGKAIGKGYIETAFRAARAADPTALLFYNDYDLETTAAKQDAVYNLIADFKSRGVPIDGVGLQSHFLVNPDGTGAPSLSQLQTTYARFAALGVRIQITELDVRVQTPGTTAAALAGQLQVYSNVVNACLGVTACEAIIVWGVTDSESGIPGKFPGWGSALLFDANLTKKTTWATVKSALGG
jgi:endo-1,4-beta-xylanase